MNLRGEWIGKLDRIARPVMEALNDKQLRQRMPVEHHPKSADRSTYTYLEALGRTLCGLTPWIELDGAALDAPEKTLHAEFRVLAAGAIAAAVDPASPDFVNFSQGHQPIVDAAFVAHGVLRAPRFFESLPATVREQLVTCFRATRTRKPAACNWLLFSAMIETALYRLTGDCDLMRIDYAIRQHQQWYLGGGMYGDGPQYHCDYYNSFVIQPMLLDILYAVGHLDAYWRDLAPTMTGYAKRYAQIQERLVAPDGTYPATGRSIAYRCGAFQHLAQMALQHQLPETLTPAQVRGALTALIRRTMDAPNTFDENGWLRIGLAGHQPSLGETYISTGSLYLCTAAFLPLGLPASDAFWSDPDRPHTSQQIWAGVDLPADHG